MKPQAGSLQMIEDFLAQKRIAMVGVSRHPSSFSHALFRELCGRGYEVVPVNPGLSEVMGRRCFARMQDVQPPVKSALVMTPPEATNVVVGDCAAAGIRRVWMFRGGGQGSVSPEAIRFCEEKGIQVIPGECPWMFLPGAGAGHRLHGFIRKITGSYPRREAA